MALARLSPGWRALMFGCILLPLWISVLVRTFSWLLLLERNGPINRAGRVGPRRDAAGGPFHPDGRRDRHGSRADALRDPADLCGAGAIDPALLRASDGLGATRLTTFRRILLPFSARGVMTAATFVFLLSFGFFITPAVLGGAKSTNLSMLIDNFVNEQLVWPLAAAASMILLGACLAMLAVVSRVIPVTGLVEAR